MKVEYTRAYEDALAKAMAEIPKNEKKPQEKEHQEYAVLNLYNLNKLLDVENNTNMEEQHILNCINMRVNTIQAAGHTNETINSLVEHSQNTLAAKGYRPAPKRQPSKITLEDVYSCGNVE